MLVLLLPKKRVKQIIIITLSLINMYLFIYILDTRSNNIDVVCYHIPKVAAFQFYYRGNALLFSDSIQNENDKRYLLNIQGHDRKKRIQNTFIKIEQDFENDFLCKKGNFISFQNRIYVIEKNRLKPNTLNLVVYENDFSNGGIHALN
jgi:hypothetical protein